MVERITATEIRQRCKEERVLKDPLMEYIVNRLVNRTWEIMREKGLIDDSVPSGSSPTGDSGTSG